MLDRCPGVGGVRVAPASLLADASAILTASVGWRPTLMIGPPPICDPVVDARIRNLSARFRSAVRIERAVSGHLRLGCDFDCVGGRGSSRRRCASERRWLQSRCRHHRGLGRMAALAHQERSSNYRTNTNQSTSSITGLLMSIWSPCARSEAIPRLKSLSESRAKKESARSADFSTKLG